MKRKVLYRLPRATEDKETGRIIMLNNLEKFYIDPEKDFGTNSGLITKNNFEKNGSFKEGKDTYVIHDSSFIDFFKQIKRRAQIITIKDIGAIIANTGLNTGSKVIDAGVGSGALACFLGKIVGKVDAFDVNDSAIEIARKNVNDLDLKNVKIEKADIYDSSNFKDNHYDVFTLDVPEPWNALKTAIKVLKVGGYLVVYAPQITQIQKVVTNLDKKFIHEKTIEIIEREWNVSERTLRPATKDFGHTAFMSFIRKIV